MSSRTSHKPGFSPWVGLSTARNWRQGTHLHLAAASNLCVLLSLAASLAAQPARLILPETGSTITLTLSPDQQSPGNFRHIHIRSSGTVTTITAQETLVRIPADRQGRAKLLWAPNGNIPGLELDASRYFMVGRYTAQNKPHTLLFFFSDESASDAAPILIIGFNDDGRPARLFDQRYVLKSFMPVPGGGRFTGNQSIPQAMCAPADTQAPSSSTYDPFSIFQITPGSKPLYLLAASRSYNRKHYVWAGPRTREDYAVIRNLPGHPRLYGAPANQLDHLLSSVNCVPCPPSTKH